MQLYVTHVLNIYQPADKIFPPGFGMSIQVTRFRPATSDNFNLVSDSGRLSAMQWNPQLPKNK